MNNNNCYGCKKRHPGCHGTCEVYAEYKDELKRVQENRDRDIIYRSYKSEKTISISKGARPYEHRGFSSM